MARQRQDVSFSGSFFFSCEYVSFSRPFQFFYLPNLHGIEKIFSELKKKKGLKSWTFLLDKICNYNLYEWIFVKLL